MPSRCKYCHRDIPYNSVFCNWCGGRQIPEVDEIKVPRPHKNGRGYYAQIMIDGRRFTISEPTEEDYYRVARELKSGKRDQASTITLEQAIDKYIQEKSNILSQRTLEQYERIKKQRFPALMTMRIDNISSNDVTRAINAELARPSRKGGTLSEKTVRDAIGLCTTVITRYTGNNLVIDLPEPQKRVKDFPTVAEVVNAIRGTDIELPCLLALWLGLSMEEIRGLTKSKSINGNRLSIVETVVDTNSGTLRKQKAKAKARPRSFNIPPYIMNLINQCPDDILEHRSGHALYMRLQKVCDKAGIKRIRFHDLRHLSAATMTSLNIPNKVLREKFGWSSDKMLNQVYDYVFNADRLEADAAIDDLFSNLLNAY